MSNDGFTGKYARVEKISRTYEAIDVDSGEILTDSISAPTRSKAAKADRLIGEYRTKTGKIQWRLAGRVVETDTPPPVTSEATPSEDVVLDAIMNGVNLDDPQSVVRFVHEKAINYKPDTLVIPELKWRYLMRSALRGENILMTGPSGCGKTFAVQSVADAFPERKFFYFNLGSTQDPRATLVGNTHYDSSTGTFFAESYFVKALRTPGAIILLDELSRAHPEAWNILMTVLDKKQRYLRLDEKEDTETVKVAPGVTFIGTANIGVEYTATRTMDRALMDRFVTIEMDVLNREQEAELLQKLYPNVDADILDSVAKVSDRTRKECLEDAGKLSAMVSTRTSVEIAALLADGFTLAEAAEVAIYPFFDNEGGLDSERTFVRQVVQEVLPNEESEEDDLLKNVEDSLENIPF